MAEPAFAADWNDEPADVTPEFQAAVVRYFTGHRWTEADLDHLPRGPRYEIIDGRLHVTPPPSESHQDWCTWAFRALDRAAPPGWRVRWEIGLAAVDDRYVPDLVVLSPETPRAESNFNPVVPALVLEVESKSTKGVDRGEKLDAYAAAGFGGYWRIERAGRLTVSRLEGDRYTQIADVESGEKITLDWPYPLAFVLPYPHEIAGA